MKRIILIPSISFALAALASAQIPDNSYWSDGNGTTAHVDVTDTGGTGVDVTVTDSTGFTPAVSGTEDPNNAGQASSFPPTATNGVPGNEYRGRNGKVQKKNAAGEWVDMRKVKKKKKPSKNQRYTHLSAGQPAPSNGILMARGQRNYPMRQGDLAPWDGLFAPGEEITSVPQR